jgi:tricorn protease
MPAFDRVVRFVASAAHEFSPAISPDGKWVAYLSNAGGRVYLIDPFGQEPSKKLIDLPADVYPRGASWAPDGSSIVFGQSRATGDIILAERSR